VCVEPDAIFIRDGDVFTSAGVSSGIDLALAMVEMDHGPELVREVARSLVVYLKRAGGQSQFSVLVEADPPPDSPLRAVADAITADPGADHSVKKLAARTSLSARQLTRLFQSELGTTPARYVELVRIDFARAALEAGRTVAETARVAGFGSTETLRRVFLNHLGITPKAYRIDFARPLLKLSVLQCNPCVACTLSRLHPTGLPWQRQCATYLALLYLLMASSSRCSAAP
jgi:transcriptional regulator GlxA family with amidase domain